MTAIKARPGVQKIAPYVGGKSKLSGQENAIKLSSNENPMGPSDAAVEAFRRATFDLHRYPSTDHLTLRAAIAKTHGLDADRIICGVGSDEIIALLCQAFSGPGDEVIHTEHGFALYKISALASGAQPVEVPERTRQTDVDAILAACTPRTKLVFIANPNNPTGTMISPSEIVRLADRLPQKVLLVLDGAYAEYVDGYDGGASIVDHRENVFMTRTFSKIHGLGGLRIGWGYGTVHVIDMLNRVRGPFNLSTAALLAAEAAIQDTDYVEKCRSENARLRMWLSDALAGHGVACDLSHANFVLARFADAKSAQACNEKLEANGLIVRLVANYNLPDALRITIGEENACRQVAHVIGRFMRGEE